MPRIKERRKILHQPSTHEILYCLGAMPAWSKLLLEHQPGKIYADFLDWLLQNDFHRHREEKVSIKQIAADVGITASKASQWLKTIYLDVLDLNEEQRALFQGEGIKVCLYFSHYDSHCGIYTSVPALPREFERVNFYFVKARVGTERFWVKEVEHEMSENPAVTIWLQGGILNRYREFAIDKALFQGHLHFMDAWGKHDFEVDDILKKLYRN